MMESFADELITRREALALFVDESAATPGPVGVSSSACTSTPSASLGMSCCVSRSVRRA